MDWIDEKGRLFGRVNVIDALVVLFALAVVVAGAAFVLGGGGSDSSETVTQHATVTLGEQPAQVSALVTTGTVTVDGTEMELTDVYRTPAEDGSTIVRLRLAFEGRDTEDGFRAAGQLVRSGTTVTLATDAYELQGTVRGLADDGSFETSTTSTTVTATVTDEVATAIATGDTRTLAGTEVLRVTGVDRESVNTTHSRVRVDLALRTLSTAEGPAYAGGQLRLGQRLPVVTDRYEFTGTVVAVATDD
ncbi:DUF4330 family protein [Natronomonas sp. EA1]|uniref:DUF4330 family protein n=1 Tax=Natronomonas sp. EA1 TaxID=3421655 RepID=UPI003EBD2EB8